jgi:hypothetical protein
VGFSGDERRGDELACILASYSLEWNGARLQRGTGLKKAQARPGASLHARPSRHDPQLAHDAAPSDALARTTRARPTASDTHATPSTDTDPTHRSVPARVCLIRHSTTHRRAIAAALLRHALGLATETQHNAHSHVKVSSNRGGLSVGFASPPARPWS